MDVFDVQIVYACIVVGNKMFVVCSPFSTMEVYQLLLCAILFLKASLMISNFISLCDFLFIVLYYRASVLAS